MKIPHRALTEGKRYRIKTTPNSTRWTYGWYKSGDHFSNDWPTFCTSKKASNSRLPIYSNTIIAIVDGEEVEIV